MELLKLLISGCHLRPTTSEASPSPQVWIKIWKQWKIVILILNFNLLNEVLEMGGYSSMFVSLKNKYPTSMYDFYAFMYQLKVILKNNHIFCFKKRNNKT